MNFIRAIIELVTTKLVFTPQYHRPEGSISSAKELLLLTRGKEGVLYYVINGTGWGNSGASYISIKTFDTDAYLDGNLFFLNMSKKRARDILFLRDCNIGSFNDCNSHFVFADLAEASAYLELAKQGWEKDKPIP